MYTKFTITINDLSATFHAHELVAIMIGLNSKKDPVNGLLSTIKKDKRFIPQKSDFNRYAQKFMTGYDINYLRGQHDEAILLPMIVQPMSTIAHYFYVADAFATALQQHDVRLDGWWPDIGNRTLYLKNQDKKTQFYISDFGLRVDLYDSLKRVIIETPWLEQAENQGSAINFALTELTKLYRNGKLSCHEMIPMYRGLLSGLPFAHLHEIFPSRSAEQLASLFYRIQTDDDYAAHHISRIFHEADYIADKLKLAYNDMAVQKPQIITEINKAYPFSQRMRNALIKRLVGMDLIRNVNEGHHDNFLRPKHAFFHADSDGASYPALAKIIGNYLEKYQCKSCELARLFRLVLKGDYEPPEELDFLPNLAAAWFVAEAIRNPLSIPIGLMILDFMQNPHWLADDSPATKRWYTWKHLFLHPNEGTETECVDLYGTPIVSQKKGTEPIIYFRGLHPMVHLDSRRDAGVKLVPQEKLTRVRQKEGSILLHWLVVQLKRKLPNAEIKAVIFDSNQPDTFMNIPDYAEISLLMKLSNNAKKIIAKDPILKFKFDILHNDIVPLLFQRANTLDEAPIHVQDFLKPMNTPPEKLELKPTRISNSVGENCHFIMQPSSDHHNLYEIVRKASMAASLLVRFSSQELQMFVASTLLHYKPLYRAMVKDALCSLILSQISQVETGWIVGPAEILANPEKFLNISSINLIADANSLIKATYEYAFISAQEAYLPTLPKISQDLQAATKNLKIFVLLQWADSIWFKKRMQFLHQLLSLPNISKAEYLRIHREIQNLFERAKKADARYEALYDKEVDSKLYDLYCDNARMINASVGLLEIELLALILKIDIHLYEGYNSAAVNPQQVVMMKTSKGVQQFQRGAHIPARGDTVIELFHLGPDQGFAHAKRSPGNMIDYKVKIKASTDEDGLIVSLLKAAKLEPPPIYPLNTSQGSTFTFFEGDQGNDNATLNKSESSADEAAKVNNHL